MKKNKYFWIGSFMIGTFAVFGLLVILPELWKRSPEGVLGIGCMIWVVVGFFCLAVGDDVYN